MHRIAVRAALAALAASLVALAVSAHAQEPVRVYAAAIGDFCNTPAEPTDAPHA